MLFFLSGRYECFFVVRLKKDIKDRRLVEFDQPDDREHDMFIDEAVRFEGEQTLRRCSHPIRLVTVYAHGTMEEPIELLTHDARRDVAMVAALYKACWQIEILFKMIRQLLRTKSFVATRRERRMHSNPDSHDSPFFCCNASKRKRCIQGTCPISSHS